MTRTARQTRLDPRAPLVLDTHELGRRPGTMLQLQLEVPAPEDLGNGVIGVSAGAPLQLDLRMEAVMDGVLVSGTATAEATGECVRCLDPVAETVVVDLQELFLYEPADDPDADEELPLLEGDLLDLEPAVRDSLVPALPFQPVCDPDCPGLCSRCGARLLEDPDHSHEDNDPRWAALAGLTDKLGQASDAGSGDGAATAVDPAGTEEETN